MDAKIRNYLNFAAGMRKALLIFLLCCLAPGLKAQPDTLRSAVISAVQGRGELLPGDTIPAGLLQRAVSVADAVRTFGGVQIRDYGGVGGLKTINVRSLGSEHTGVFLDGIRIDNTQNMQVDLGRYATDGLAGIRLYQGQKAGYLQSAKEYGNANALYLTSARPEKNGMTLRFRTGSFGTYAPALTVDRRFGSRISLRAQAEYTASDGRYPFHVSDSHTLPDGTHAGYDTVMTRQNGDLHSLRAALHFFGPGWHVQAWGYGSGRGLPGPVYKRAGTYPLSRDRQDDRNFFLQGEWTAGPIRLKGKLSHDALRFTDHSETNPDLDPAIFNYATDQSYLSAAGLLEPLPWWKISLAADLQATYMDADLRDFVYPFRLSGWLAAAQHVTAGPLQASASLLYEAHLDRFGTLGDSRFRDVLSPALILRYDPAAGWTFSAFAKRSWRLPSFNDLYYTNVGSANLRPEDAWQAGLDVSWSRTAGPWRFEAKAEGYVNRIRDKIIAVPTASQFRWSMYNIGDVRILGSDLRAVIRHECISLDLRYTFQQARDHTAADKGQVPYIPIHSGSATLSGTWHGWTADLTIFATGERFTASSNLPMFRLAPWLTADADFGKRLPMKTGELTVRLSLRNLTGEQYEIVDRYPMPGRNVLLTLDYSF